MNVAIITEASGQIGTGHLVEGISLAKHLSLAGLEVELWVNEGGPESFISGSSCLSINLYKNLAQDINHVIREIQNKCGEIVVFDLRKLDNAVMMAFSSYFKTVCIDELGCRRLDCDAIINPLIVSAYHKYESGAHHSSTLFLGPDYYIMAEGITKAHRTNRVFTNSIKEISICMGGVDRTGATLRIIDALAGWKDNVMKNVILGGGFRYLRETRQKLDALHAKNFRLFQGVDNIEDFFLASDVVFSAGGNTLYELSCTGTPAIVLYEDEHEKENGLAFANRGFGYCLGSGVSFESELIWDHLNLLESSEIRQSQSSAGKALVDGDGAARIAELVRKLINDLPIQTFS